MSVMDLGRFQASDWRRRANDVNAYEHSKQEINGEAANAVVGSSSNDILTAASDGDQRMAACWCLGNSPGHEDEVSTASRTSLVTGNGPITQTRLKVATEKV